MAEPYLKLTHNQETLPPASPLPPPPEGRPPWALRDLVVFVVFFLASGVMVQLAARFVYAFLRPWLGWKLSPEVFASSAFVLLSLQMLMHGLLFCFIYFLIVFDYRCPFWPTVQLRKPSGRLLSRALAVGIALGLAVRFAPTVLPDKDTFPLQQLFTSPQAAYAIAFFAVVAAPFMEELIFRGFMFPILETRFGVYSALLGTALLFALLHVPEYWGAWNHLALILVVGLVLSSARAITGSLAPSMIIHSAYNTVLMIFLFIETDRFRLLAT